VVAERVEAVSGFDAALWIDDDPAPLPEKKAVGEWRCECGLTMVHPMPGNVPYSITGRCLTCGDEAEVMPE
jgi:hypothetical protein